MRDNIKMEIKEMIAKANGEFTVTEIKDDTNLLLDLGFDSIMLVQLLADIEERYNILIKDEDMDTDILYIVSSLVKTIEKYV